MKQQIAASLEVAFSQYGFAEPNVDKLKTACNVSLRTLYKHYPSKESMVIAALDYRHQRYLAYLESERPEDGVQSIVHTFQKLGDWMADYAPHGCLSMNAIAAFPKQVQINQAVLQHKAEVRDLLGKYSQRPDLANTLLVLHEGISSAWPILGENAISSATSALLTLLNHSEMTTSNQEYSL
ncbi:TetR/AcrR family transcriptional regulator [Marinomonas arenicola]|uniref:TetR/AcrR family transcriptional regulator n=1 Tax=Marinomonas arenicola TaxID=569601 RepID=UPI00311E1CC4